MSARSCLFPSRLRTLVIAMATVVLVAGAARVESAVLYTRSTPLTVDETAEGYLLPGCTLTRNDAARDTLWLRFSVQPASDMTCESYVAGLQFLRPSAPLNLGLGIGNALASNAYGAWNTSRGEWDFKSRTPDPGTYKCAVRRGDVTTLLVRVRYMPNAIDTVTVWLSPDSTLNETLQSDSLRTVFTADAGFQSLALRESGGAEGWTFSRLAIATQRAELFGPAAFADATTLTVAYCEMGQGVSWADVDGDGDHDLMTTDETAGVRLFRNDGRGGFTIGTPDALALTDATEALNWCDLDGDGDLDVYASRYGAPNRLLRNDGAGVFVDVTSGPLADAGVTTASVWGDMDRDGDLDLFVTDFAGTDHLYRNDRAAGFVDATPPLLAGPGNSTSAVWGDVDGDGDLDLFVAHLNRPNHLYRNEGQGVFSDLVQPDVNRPGYCFGSAFADYDDDGDLDLFVVGNGESHRLLRNDHGVFHEAAAGPLAVPMPGVGCAWADVDNDGDLDVFVTSYGDGDRLFRNDGDGVFSEATGVLGTIGFDTGAAWGDMDGDGDLDLYEGNEGDGNHLFRNTLSSGNHWLQVGLVGTASNRAGIGAQVRVVSGGRVQMRELSGGSGFGSQDALVAAFGLGADTRVDTLSVRWPSGVVQVLRGVAAVDRRMAVVEPPLVLGVEDASVTGLRCAPAAPNPFRVATQVAFQMPRDGVVRATVHDVQGRLVATLAQGAFAAGAHTLQWNGCDARGQRVRDGLYLVRLALRDASGNATHVEKLVLTR